ncbi:MAG: ABC transporter substrate-binding protein, partial [Haemophilus parainfluenzae]|nr:ABC transporter substrate-binding protein [Haemophilus parainfluenzae]
MDNSFLTWLKSAVIFGVVFGLSGCDKLNSQKSINTETDEQPTQSQSIKQENTSKPNRTLLTRAFTHPPSFEPWFVRYPEQEGLLRDLYEGLTAYDPEGRIVPGIAESWETKDNKTWIFTLREGLRWSNGDPLVAQDVMLSWQALSQSNSPLRSYLAYLNLKNAKGVLEKNKPFKSLGIYAENDRTLRIELDKATPYLPEMLAHISLVPQYRDPDSSVTNGAYMIESESVKSIYLTKNPYYWQKNNVAFERVEYLPFIATKLPDFDVVLDVPEVHADLQHFPQLCSYFYEFNLNDPKVAKADVRKAIASLVSVTNIVNNEIPAAIPSSYFLPKAMLNGQDSRWEPVVAEQLLAQNKIDDKYPLHLNVLYDDEPLHVNIAQRLV